MASMEVTKNFFKKYKIFVTVFIVTVILFWLLYFYYDVKSWHQKNTDIIGERLDEIIQQTALSASHLSGYRPLLSSVELDAPLPAEHILNQWKIQNSYIDTIIFLNEHYDFFSMNRPNESMDMDASIIFQDVDWIKFEFTNTDIDGLGYLLADLNNKKYLFLNETVKRDERIAGYLVIGLDVENIFSNLKKQQRIFNDLKITISNTMAGNISCFDSHYLKNDYVCSEISFKFVLKKIISNFLLIIFTISTGIIFSVIFTAHKSNRSKLKIISNLSSQVAHDIRSPLTALNVVAQHLKDLPEDQRLLIRSAVQRIEDIANDLAGKRRQDERDAEDQNAIKVQLLSSLIEPLISEKRVQMRSKRGIRIESDLSADSYGLFAKIQPVQFKRVLSNLINNSVEALGENGLVKISLTSDDSDVQITVSDNGKGIPQDVLPKLMQKGASFGKESSKESGSGLGLYHARESVESWNGKVEIQSEVGKGTQIIVRLPKAPPPDWFVPEIEVKNEMHIIILDDDNSIHQVWQGRFDAMNFDKNRIFHFTSPQAIISWYSKNKNEKASYLFLCDYELLGNKENGLDVIEQLGIGNSSILVTSRFEEEGVKKGCERLGVKLLPKNLAGFVPIIFESRDDSKSDAEYILIDDKSIVRKTWEMGAKIANKKVATYSCVDEFMRDADLINKDTSIYIDSDLGEGNRGEVLSEKIYDKGFKKIFLTTGFGKNDFKNIPWITDVVDKDPPFLRR